MVFWRVHDGTIPLPRLGVSMVWVGLWMSVQIISDYRHAELWYQRMTTLPFGLSLGELLLLRWPTIVCFVFGYAMDGTLILGLILVSLLMFYPWQRRLYLRSQREFGLKQQSTP